MTPVPRTSPGLAEGAEISDLCARPARPGGWRAHWREAWLRPIPEVLHEHSWFIALAFVYLAVGYAVTGVFGQEVRLGLYSSLQLSLYFNFASVILIARVVWVLVKRRPDRPLRFVWNDLRTTFFTPRRVLGALPAFVLLPVTLSMMTSLKRMIPLVAPYQWDAALAEADRILHAGYHPWELLQPVLGDPLVTVLLSYAYALPWYAMVVFLPFWLTFSLDPARIRFLVSYLLCWALLGNGFALAMSSAGPCYYQYFVGGPNPFAPLMSFLKAVHADYGLPSIMGQEYLWDAYQEDFLRLGSGISAMPSMHISTTFVFVLVCWRRHAALRWASLVFLMVMLAGSVHLGWHYAIDGYAAILGTILIWMAVGRAMAWRARGTGPRPVSGRETPARTGP